MRIAYKIGALCICIFLLFVVFDTQQKEEKLQDIRSALANKQWSQAENLLKAYLASEIDVQQSWKVWLLFIDMSRMSDLHPDTLLSYLHAMLKDYGTEPDKKKFILLQIAEITERKNNIKSTIEAWEAYAKQRNLLPDEAYKAHRKLLRMYYEQSNFTKAQEVLNDCIALPISAEKLAYCQYNLADIFAEKGDLEVATEYIVAALNAPLDPYTKAQTQFLHADILEQQRKYKEALAQFTLAKEHYGNAAVVDVRIARLKKILKIK